MNQKPIYEVNFETAFHDAVVLASGDGFAKEADRLIKTNTSRPIKDMKELHEYYSDIIQLAFGMILRAKIDCYDLGKEMNILFNDS